MKKLLAVPLLLTTLLGSSLALAASYPASVDVQQAAKLQSEGVFLLDVREPGEYAEIHAKNATLIPLGQLQSRLNELAQYKNKPVAVICRSGRRSARGMEILQSAGFTQVSNVKGGTIAWANAGLPVVRN